LNKAEAFLYKNHPVMWLASKHHKTHKNEMLDFVNYPYLRHIYLDENEKDIMKSTQSGLTEWLIVLAFSLAMNNKQIFYTLPTIELVNRFVKNRFDKSIEHSNFYEQVLNSGLDKASDAVSLKHIMNGAIAFTGSNSTVGFTEYPADILIVDEEDECDLRNLEMAVERLSNSDDRREFRVANPTILKYGIHGRWLKSSQSLWNIKADCGHRIQPDPFKHLLRQVDEHEYIIRDEKFDWDSGQDINLICHECGKPVHRRGPGEWVPTFKGKKEGLQINKLFSTKVTLREIVERFDKGLTNETVLQRCYNGDFGLPYTAEGSNVTTSSLDKCIEDFFMTESYTDSVCVLGCDVGTMLHVKISSITPEGKLRARFIGAIQTEEEFNGLFKRFNILAGVIDAMPEQRMSKRLVAKHKGLFRCFYGEGKEDIVTMETKTITVHRTSALDNVKESILLKNTLLPKNIADIPEYYDHMTASTRVYDEKKEKYNWVETGPDHFFHASGYEMIAKNLLMRLAS